MAAIPALQVLAAAHAAVHLEIKRREKTIAEVECAATVAAADTVDEVKDIPTRRVRSRCMRARHRTPKGGKGGEIRLRPSANAGR